MLQDSGSIVRRLSWLAVIVVAMTGCGGSDTKVVKVTGKVTYKGEPAKLGTVQFQPAPGSGPELPPATGVINADGTYMMRTVHGEGVPPGKYTVLITSMDSIDLTGDMPKPKWLIPEKFSKPDTSGMSTEVAANAKDLVLDWKLE